MLWSCLTLCDPMDYSLPDFSVHGILQARIREWVAMPSSRRSSRPRDRTHISCISYIARQILYHSATRGAHLYIYMKLNAKKRWKNVTRWYRNVFGEFCKVTPRKIYGERQQNLCCSHFQREYELNSIHTTWMALEWRQRTQIGLLQSTQKCLDTHMQLQKHIITAHLRAERLCRRTVICTGTL